MLKYTNYFTLPMCFLCINTAPCNYRASNRALNSFILYILLYLNSLTSSLKIWWNFQLGFRNVFHEHFI